MDGVEAVGTRHSKCWSAPGGGFRCSRPPPRRWPGWMSCAMFAVNGLSACQSSNVAPLTDDIQEAGCTPSRSDVIAGWDLARSPYGSFPTTAELRGATTADTQVSKSCKRQTDPEAVGMSHEVHGVSDASRKSMQNSKWCLTRETSFSSCRMKCHVSRCREIVWPSGR